MATGACTRRSSQTAPISGQLLNSPDAGLYRIFYYLVVQEAGSAGDITFSITYLNTEGDPVTDVSPTGATVQNNGHTCGVFVAWTDGNDMISFATQFNGVQGINVVYDLQIHCEKIC